MRRTGLDPYDPITAAAAIALAYPSSTKANHRELVRRAWTALENLEKHGELTSKAVAYCLLKMIRRVFYWDKIAHFHS